MAAGGSKQGVYDHLYTRFFASREGRQGYDFQHAPGGSVAPQTVTFAQSLRWWTWDRWQRRKRVMAERDRLQQEIIALRKTSPTKAKKD